MRYTKGPWKVEINADQIEVCVSDSFTLPIEGISDATAESFAVAALVRAAPELRDALREVERSAKLEHNLGVRVRRVLESIPAEEESIHDRVIGKPDGG